MMTSDDDLFLFGYGSLCWRPGEVVFSDSRPALVRGFKRRFWQRSEDHRGVPGAPGRVVVCVRQDVLRDVDPHRNADVQVVQGRLFRVPAAEREKTLEYLGIREKGGYSDIMVPVYEDVAAQEPLCSAVLFSATEDNEFFAGHDTDGLDLDQIAAVIAKSVGPSGANVEYLFNLAQWLRDNQLVDEHVFDLERRVRRILEQPSEEVAAVDVIAK
jgi:cation transport protein ChaC